MLKRHIQEEIESYLKFMPVVLVTGARQTGKTTLVEYIVQEKEYTTVTFDDETTLSNATRDPSGWLMSLPKPVVIDEIQRFPELFLQIKQDVDKNRIPGRYLLTGSANPLLLPRLGDSLAGRMAVVSLLPFSQGEIYQHKERFIETIFNSPLQYQKLGDLISTEEIYKIFLRGGFPSVQNFQNIQDIQKWVQAYLQTIMQRDVRDIANIEGIREFPRLFKLLATRTANLLNASDISRTLGMVHVTLNRYLRLLETLYFIYLLPSWYTNLGKRLIKSPKLHICDTAILAQLLSVDDKKLIEDPMLAGQFLESFVFAELLKQKSWSKIRFELYHFRDGDYEVDFVLEQADGTIVGIEVKSAQTLSSQDIKGLKYLKKITGKNFTRGIVLHFGATIELLDEDIWAMPIQCLWS